MAKNTKGNKILVGYITQVMKFAEICSKYERQASAVFDFALAYSAADFVGASSNKLAALAQANPGCIQLAKEQLAKSSGSADKDREIERLRDIYNDAAGEQVALRKEYNDLEKKLTWTLDGLDNANAEIAGLKADNKRLVERLKEVGASVESSSDSILKEACREALDVEAKAVEKAPKVEVKADNDKPSVEELRQIFPGVADGLLDWAWAKKCEQDLASSVNFGSLEID